MDIVEAFAFLFLFIACYGTMMLAGWVIDKALRRFFNVGIFPERYFKL